VVGIIGWRRSTALILAAVTAAFGLLMLWGQVSWGMAGFSFVVPFYGITVAMMAWGHAWRLGSQLRFAEEEVRRLAAANERLALARDLHDVVGHSLSVLALRADLAAAHAEPLAPLAASEMRQVADLARDALHDIRRVVSNWRTTSFREEWRRSREILAAAGIVPEEAGLEQPLSPELDQVMAYWVREGVTNVLRHSNATRCRLTVEVNPQATVVTLEDNGPPRDPLPDCPPGNGLTGLRERLASLGGQLEAQQIGAGFRLRALLPSLPTIPVERPPEHRRTTSQEVCDYA
jgi:two-component system sensor histidine kinase DesK